MGSSVNILYSTLDHLLYVAHWCSECDRYWSYCTCGFYYNKPELLKSNYYPYYDLILRCTVDGDYVWLDKVYKWRCPNCRGMTPEEYIEKHIKYEWVVTGEY